MTVGIDRVAAPLTVRSAGGDDLGGVRTERGGLGAGDVQTNVPVSALDLVALLVDRADFLQLHDQSIGAAVVAEPDRAEHESLLDGLSEFEGTSHRLVLGWREIVEYPFEILHDRRDLLLLALDRHPLAALSGLQEERACSGLSDRTGREGIDLLELVEHAHAGAAQRVAPAERMRTELMMA